MKKKILIPIVIIVVLLVVLFTPFSIRCYKDGGTVEYTSLTYKIIKWKIIDGDGYYQATDVYYFPDNFKSADGPKKGYPTEEKFKGVIKEIYDTSVIVEPFAEEWERQSSDKISFGTSKLEKIKVAKGDIVEVTYTGDIMCTYPAQIFAKSWKLVEEEHDCQDTSSSVLIAKKPVIYLYPEKETGVSVELSLNGKLTCTYPEYKNGWQVTAKPNGTLTDNNGMQYSYLYWEGDLNAEYDFSKGFCVKGEDTAEFLEDALDKLGLNRSEANEFIVYWLPLMQENPYNIISFQTEAYESSAKLNINPVPDTLIRVFMAYKPADKYKTIEKQELTAPQRTGFTAVEWGGTQVD